MTRRFFILGLASAMLALAGTSVRAGSLPASLDSLLGSSVTVGDLTISPLSYVTTPVGSPPPASQVTVAEFNTVAGYPGITFNGAFHADAGQNVDYAIRYTVATTDGALINGAYLALGGFTNSGGTGFATIGETILNAAGQVINQKNPFDVFTNGSAQLTNTTALIPPASSITIEKDITVFGGSDGATISFVNQGFSVDVGAIPEPTSMALLGLGLTGLFTFRRFFKRAFIA